MDQRNSTFYLVLVHLSHIRFYLYHVGWFILRVGTNESYFPRRIQPQACFLFRHLLTTIHFYAEGLLCSRCRNLPHLYVYSI